MKKELIYNIPLLEITVILNVSGWQIFINTRLYCEKKRMGRTWLEREGYPERINLHNLENPGYSILEEQIWSFKYSQTVRLEDKDKSILLLKEKIFEKVCGWSSLIGRLIENSTNTKTFQNQTT